MFKNMGNLNATTSEQVEVIADFGSFDLVIIIPDADVLVSINDNSTYIKCAGGTKTPLPGPVQKIYYKTSSGTGALSYLAFK